jgi:putative polyhydroxyalkanoate system protein
MSALVVDVPHSLGAAEARRRIEGGTGQLVSSLPGGVRAKPAWNGDRLDLAVDALGQAMTASLDVQERIVRVSVVLPPALSFLRPMIESGIRRAGAELLEDKRAR